MKTVTFLKKYKLNDRRTWDKGEQPQISTALAIELRDKGFISINGESRNPRGITNEELEDLEINESTEPENKKK